MNKMFFYLRRDISIEGKSPIYCRISKDNQKDVSFTIDRKIDPERWDKTKHLKITTIQDEKDLNTYLNNVENKIKKYEQELTAVHINPTPCMLKQSYKNGNISECINPDFNKKDEKTILKTFGEFLDYYKERVNDGLRSNATWKKYNSIRNLLKEFIDSKYSKGEDIELREIDKTFIDNFVSYILTQHPFKKQSKKGCSINTTYKYMKQFKAFIHYALDSGYISTNPCKDLIIKPEKQEPTFLTQEEVDRITNLKFNIPRLTFIKDIFIFICYSSLSPVDLRKLTWENIVEENGVVWIKIKRQKSKEFCKIPLFPESEKILCKYGNGTLTGNTGRVFKLCSDVNLNFYLKEIFDAARIPESKIGTLLVGRHTFASLMPSYGFSLLEISKMMGHTSIKTTMIYVSLSDSEFTKSALSAINNMKNRKNKRKKR